MIAVVDYDAGNLTSVVTALRHLSASFVVSSDGDSLRKADKIIFPGVGEAGQAMGELRRRGLDEALKESISIGIPTLGICIGSQILLGLSEEGVDGPTPCLGVVPGRARAFRTDFQREGITDLKVPHMGWNQVLANREHPSARLFTGIPENSSFYFVHSYYPDPEDDTIALTRTEYGIPFVSSYGRENLVACQFHPEKSGPVGLRLLENFIGLF